PHAPEHVAEPAEADDQHARDDHVPQDHPQQVEAVARHQRVQADAAEDVRHRDDRDRGVERRQQDPERAVGQGDPLASITPCAAGHSRAQPALRSRCLPRASPVIGETRYAASWLAAPWYWLRSASAVRRRSCASGTAIAASTHTTRKIVDIAYVIV